MARQNYSNTRRDGNRPDKEPQAKSGRKKHRLTDAERERAELEADIAREKLNVLMGNVRGAALKELEIGAPGIHTKRYYLVTLSLLLSIATQDDMDWLLGSAEDRQRRQEGCGKGRRKGPRRKRPEIQTMSAMPSYAGFMSSGNS